MIARILLITGFKPFGGRTINPAWEAVKALPCQICDWSLVKLEIPTVFEAAAKMILYRAAEVQPRAILSIGQAAGRSAITPVLVGINLCYTNIPDNGRSNHANRNRVIRVLFGRLLRLQ